MRTVMASPNSENTRSDIPQLCARPQRQSRPACSATTHPAGVRVIELRGRAPTPVAAHVVIEPSRSWVALNLRDLWRYRELLYFLVWRDVKVRYKHTVVGMTWVVLQPLLTTFVFTIFL